jgi:hypothetical protein
VLKSKIGMVNKFLSLLRKNKRTEPKYLNDPRSRLANEQFKRLIERGIDLPVVLL